MEVHDDRVEIVNPGGLPKGLSLRELGKVSIRRNEIIADLFFRMQKVERIGMGIQKMRDLMVAAGLKAPIFEPNGFFRAIFHRSPEFALKNGRPTSEKEFGEKFGESSEKGSEKSSEKILSLLEKRNTASAREIAEALDLTQRAVEKQIAMMKAAGRLRRHGSPRGGHWEVLRQRGRQLPLVSGQEPGG